MHDGRTLRRSMSFSDKQLGLIESMVDLMCEALNSQAAYALDRMPARHTQRYVDGPSAEWAVAITKWDVTKSESAWCELRNAYDVAEDSWTTAARDFRPLE